MLTPILILAASLLSAPADAGVYFGITPAGWHVVVDPWSPAYRPPARPGFTWIAGHYDAWGRWIPGHWLPVAARPGYVWVPGYWSGPTYVDGYWRPAYRAGYVWVDGRYDGGHWNGGYWAPNAYSRHVAAERYHAREDWHDRAEDRADAREDARDRAEERADAREDARDRAEDRADHREDARDQREDRRDARR